MQGILQMRKEAQKGKSFKVTHPVVEQGFEQRFVQLQSLCSFHSHNMQDYLRGICGPPKTTNHCLRSFL